MALFIEILVCLLASLGAGLGTGLAGLSAAAVITPMLVTFLDVPAYQAIGIALASDVLASAVSSITYAKNKNLDVKNGLILLAFVLIFTYVGSYVSSLVKSESLGFMSIIFTLILGIKFIIAPKVHVKENKKNMTTKSKVIKSIIFGSMIGFICGFVGAGGGMMMLMVLTLGLGYELKMAVGTSVFVMSFTALTGSISHFVIGGIYDYLILILCIVFTCIFAQLASLFANKASEKTMGRATGIVLTILGVVMLIFNLI